MTTQNEEKMNRSQIGIQTIFVLNAMVESQKKASRHFAIYNSLDRVIHFYVFISKMRLRWKKRGKA